jgi:hypothetical protein
VETEKRSNTGISVKLELPDSRIQGPGTPASEMKETQDRRAGRFSCKWEKGQDDLPEARIQSSYLGVASDPSGHSESSEGAAVGSWFS